MRTQLREVVRACALPLIERAARSYVAGPELKDALRISRWVSGQGSAITLAFWNRTGELPRRVADAYVAALQALDRENLNCYLSIKAPSLGFDRDLLAEILEQGQRTGIPVHFDSLGPESADETFSLIGWALPRYPQIGCTIPGRWRRSFSDVDRAVEMKLSVRVVKGEWVDAEKPEVDLRTGFLAVIDRLAGRARRVAVATHDPPLAREALRRLQAAGTPCSLELLFGLPVRKPLRVAFEVGVPVRFYVAYGRAWLPYCLSQFRKKPHIVCWLLRDAIGGHFGRLPRGSAARAS